MLALLFGLGLGDVQRVFGLRPHGLGLGLDLLGLDTHRFGVLFGSFDHLFGLLLAVRDQRPSIGQRLVHDLGDAVLVLGPVSINRFDSSLDRLFFDPPHACLGRCNDRGSACTSSLEDFFGTRFGLGGLLGSLLLDLVAHLLHAFLGLVDELD